MALNVSGVPAVDLLSSAWAAPLVLASILMALAAALYFDWRSERDNRRSLHWALAVLAAALTPAASALKAYTGWIVIDVTMLLHVDNVLFTALLVSGLLSGQRREQVARSVSAVTAVLVLLIAAAHRADHFGWAIVIQSLVVVPWTLWAAWHLWSINRARKSIQLLPIVLILRTLMYSFGIAATAYDPHLGSNFTMVSQPFYTLVAVAMTLHIMAGRRATVLELRDWMSAAGELAKLSITDQDLRLTARDMLRVIRHEVDCVAAGLLKREPNHGEFVPLAYNGPPDELAQSFANLPAAFASELKEFASNGKTLIWDTMRNPGLAERISAVRLSKLRFILMMPLIVADRVMGILFVAFGPARIPDRSLLQAADVLAHSVSAKIELGERVREIRMQARADSLTELPNRLSLHEDFARMQAARSVDGPVNGFMMLIDLDRFKEINDSLGHLMGDMVLIRVADRLRAFCARYSLFCARLGGDEFALYGVLEHEPDEETLQRRARELHDVLRDAYDIDDLRLSVDSSIGMSRMPADGTGSHELLRCADIAMYHAKVNGLIAAFYNASLEGDSRERVELSSLVHVALEREQFQLFFQPQIRLEDNRVVGVEALIRWHEPERGWIPPGRFIPLIELGPLIDPVSLWVARTAIAQLRRWRQAGRDWTVSINVSARNLQSDSWCESFMAMIRSAELPTGSLEIELTETSLMSSPDEISRRLHAIAGCGVRIALDDFGTGYSSLSYLQRQDFHTLKIDQSFISRMDEGEQRQQLVRSMISMATNLGMSVVAEGVETTPARDVLREIGCEYAQGYLYAAPLPADQLERWADGREAKSAQTNPMGSS